MNKRVAGGAFIAASVLAIHTSQILMDSGLQVGTKALGIPAGQVPITLVETVDGDTIKAKVVGKVETIRYLLVDTPESKKPGMCVQPYAREAAIRNEQLVKSGSLTIEFEEGDARDSYGRLLAYVYVNGKSVQETLLEEGFARVAYVLNPPYKYLSLYKKDESLAKGSKIKIWGRPGFVTKSGFNGC